MNDKSREAVSALVDGEARQAGIDEPLNELASHAELRTDWAAYHLIGDAMRASLPDTVTTNLAARVRAGVDEEPVVLSIGRARNRFVRPAAGFALAASVALFAILAVRGIDRPVVPQTSAIAEIQQPRVGLPDTVLASGNRWNVQRRSVEDRLNGYLVNHNEYAGYGVQGMLPYARIVGYDTSQP